MVLPFLVFYWQVPFLADRTIGNDYVAFPIYQQMELQYSLKHGSFPLYVPGYAGGQSSAALTLGQIYHPISHLASVLPGYWGGNALQWNTLLRLLLLGLTHLGLFILLVRLRLTPILSFIISFITVYNMRMLDLFHYGASLENYTGYLFDPYSINDLCSKIRKVLENKLVLEEMRENCLETARKFSLENKINRYLEIYNRVASDNLITEIMNSTSDV